MDLYPLTLKPCIDDLCRGSLECFKCHESMVEKCDGCGQYVALNGQSDVFQCECEPDDGMYDCLEDRLNAALKRADGINED